MGGGATLGVLGRLLPGGGAEVAVARVPVGTVLERRERRQKGHDGDSYREVARKTRKE